MFGYRRETLPKLRELAPLAKFYQSLQSTTGSFIDIFASCRDKIHACQWSINLFCNCPGSQTVTLPHCWPGPRGGRHSDRHIGPLSFLPSFLPPAFPPLSPYLALHWRAPFSSVPRRANL